MYDEFLSPLALMIAARALKRAFEKPVNVFLITNLLSVFDDDVEWKTGRGKKRGRGKKIRHFPEKEQRAHVMNNAAEVINVLHCCVRMNESQIEQRRNNWNLFIFIPRIITCNTVPIKIFRAWKHMCVCVFVRGFFYVCGMHSFYGVY